MRIPEVREELLDIAGDVERVYRLPGLAGRLRRLERELYRRSPVRRALPRRLVRLTPDDILNRAMQYPDASYMEIAEFFGCSIGRVSEALAGFRK